MKVIVCPNPNTPLIKQCLDKVDFHDTFATINRINNIQEISNLIFGKAPKWVESLMRLRNFFARMIGLNVEKPENVNETFEVGGFISFFKIYQITENEVILGADDSHLLFRVSVLNDNAKKHNIKVTTLVEYVNRTGKIYMFFVKPFHRMIVRRMVMQAYLPA